MGLEDDFLGVYSCSLFVFRVCAALGVGCALGLSGAIFQAISGNPLGSPDIVGLSLAHGTTGALASLWVQSCGERASGARGRCVSGAHFWVASA